MKADFALDSGASGPATILPGSEQWFTAADLAELGLPGLPGDKRSLNRRIADENWALRCDPSGRPLARARAGRGGGMEFHAAVLPAPARLELARRGISSSLSPLSEGSEKPAAGSWRWFEGQTERTRREAQRRVTALDEIALLEASGTTRSAAIAAIARDHGVGKATLWNWLALVDGVARPDWLPALAPRRQGGGAEAAIDPLLWQVFRSDYLRLEQPTLASCYARTMAIASARGLDMPSERTLRRKLEREIDPQLILLRRKGSEALRRSVPAQRRTVAHLHAMEHVNVDGHKFDVFVKLEDGRTIRPLMVAIQDLYSRKLLAWRIGESENAVLTRLAFADLFANFGIPKACTLDNGRAFAAKEITGGAKTRYRFKIRDEDPTGLLTGLGIAIHWATPYRGQSKPIERGFRDLCDTIAKHPAFAGAWTGNRPEAKPENYGSKAVPMAEFLQVVAQGIAAHNARLGRRTETAQGRSFDETFAASYASAPIGKASPEQMRMALLAAEQLLVDRRTGEVTLHGNRYWSRECGALHGQRVTVRFDPDDLGQDIHLYANDGRYLGSAERIFDSPFDDVASAREAKKREADLRRRVREGIAAEQLLDGRAIAALLPEPEKINLPAPAVIRPVRHRGQALALKPVPNPESSARRASENNVFTALRLIESDE